MFIRIKKSGNHQYLQIVNNVRKWNGVKQTVIGNLGRLDAYKKNTHLLELAESCKAINMKINHLPKKH